MPWRYFSILQKNVSSPNPYAIQCGESIHLIQSCFWTGEFQLGLKTIHRERPSRKISCKLKIYIFFFFSFFKVDEGEEEGAGDSNQVRRKERLNFSSWKAVDYRKSPNSLLCRLRSEKKRGWKPSFHSVGFSIRISLKGQK